GVQLEALHPSELVGELVGPDRIAVRQVEIADPHHPVAAGNERLDVARVAVRVVPGKPLDGNLIEGVPGEDRDAVETLLTMYGGVVGEVLEGAHGKGLGRALDLLQAHDVGPRVLDPGERALKPRLDAVDVPGRDFHRSWPKNRRGDLRPPRLSWL